MSIDKDGILVKNQQTIRAELEELYKEIYGGGIDLSQNTPDGQRVGIQAKVLADINELALSIYNSFDPLLAQGTQIDRLCKFVGLKRKPATQSTAKIKITHTARTTLPTDYTIKDINGNEWVLLDNQILQSPKSGDWELTFISKIYGKITAGIDQINIIQATIPTITSITNESDADYGDEEETDEELRLRFNSSKETRSVNNTLSLGAELLAIINVKDVKILENDGNSEDVNGQAAHSLNVIILGGDDDSIAKTIIGNKTAGVQLIGTETISYNTEYQGFKFTREVKFTRPSKNRTHIKFDVKKTNNVQLDEVKKLIARDLKIGETLITNSLLSPVYKKYPNITIIDVKASSDGTLFKTDNISASDTSYISIAENDITVI